MNDSYNSNPQALDAMVDALMAMPAERQIVVAGEMLELGPEAAAAACGVWTADGGAGVGCGGWGSGAGEGVGGGGACGWGGGVFVERLRLRGSG